MYSHTDAVKVSLELQIRPYLKEEQSFNAFISRDWDHEDDGDIAGQSGHDDHKRSLPPFVGNGYFGLYANSHPQYTEDSFYITGRRGLESKLPYHPIVKVLPPKSQASKGNLLHDSLKHFTDTFISFTLNSRYNLTIDERTHRQIDRI